MTYDKKTDVACWLTAR